MVTEFNGFSKGVIGKKLPSDTTLNNMKKVDLIKLLHTAQHNYDTLMWFYSNAVNWNEKTLEEMKEIRNKAIDEFAEALREKNKYFIISGRIINEIAEQMKGGA